jgi:hypothetical protein
MVIFTDNSKRFIVTFMAFLGLFLITELCFAKTIIKPLSEIIKPIPEIIKPISEIIKPSPEIIKPSPFVQCPEPGVTPNKFALCAIAKCTTIDNVAYCKCEVLNQESISLSYTYTENNTQKNVCNLLLDGLNNGFTVSTYATPRQILANYKPTVEKLGPAKALYTCNPKTNPKTLNALSAQCDGGICFDSTSGSIFPGLGDVKSNEIICSCPITKGSSVGFQIAGPYPCDRAFYKKNCEVQSTSTTGTTIMVGAVTGTPNLLSKILDGSIPSENRCDFK